MDEQAGRPEDEVLLAQGSGESNACCVADSAAVLESAGEIRGESLVDLPNRGVQRIGPCRRRPGTDLCNSGGGEDAAPASSVEEPECRRIPGHLQHVGHEAGHGRGREELTEICAALGINRDAVRDLQPLKIESI